MASSTAQRATSTVVVEPQPFPNPVITPATTRDCQVMDEQSNIRWVRCVVSSDSGLAYCFVRTLRDCIYGVVRHGVTLERDREGGAFYRYRRDRQVAIKCMSKRIIQQQRHRIREDPINELAALQLLAAPGHLHVQRLLECVEDADTIYSICPFYQGGELFSMIEDRGSGLPEDRARVLFGQILSGLEYMHAQRLCHRDMSLENILLDQDNGIIIDMGMCLRVPAPAGPGQRVLLRKQGQCGKITYMDPRVFEDHDFDGYAVDMWACGIILFILLAGVPPLELPTLADPRYQMIATGRLAELLDIWQLQLSAEARDLLTRLLQPVPEDRITLEEVLRHPWVCG